MERWLGKSLFTSYHVQNLVNVRADTQKTLINPRKDRIKNTTDKAVDKCPELSYIIEKKGNMFDKIVLKFYLWLMGWSGAINSWAWRKQAAIVREHNRKDEEDYLKELKKKL